MTRRLSDMESFARQVETCARKMVFRTEGSARIFAYDRLKKKSSTIERLWPYRCGICSDWHLTTKGRLCPAVTRATAFEPVEHTR